jgi:DNA-binding transcriptional LysR family regulator
VLADLTAHSQSEQPLPFAHERLYDGQYVCVMRKDHPLARQSLSLEDFCQARHMLVSFSGRPYGFIDEALAALGRRRHIVLTVNQFFTAGRVVARSNLLTVLPRHFISVTGIADQLALQPLPFEVPSVHVDALWHRRSQLRASHQWLRAAVQRAAARAEGMQQG